MPQINMKKGLKFLRSLTSMEDEIGRQSVYSQMADVTDNAYDKSSVAPSLSLLNSLEIYSHMSQMSLLLN